MFGTDAQIATDRMSRRLGRVPLELRIGVGILAAVLLASVLVTAVSPYGPTVGSGSDPLLPPSSLHWFGTDHLGRDVFIRTFAAARADLGLALIGISGPLVVGTLFGAFIGSTRSTTLRNAGEIAVESVNAFPTLIIVIALVAVFGRGPGGIIIGLFLTGWARYAKVARGRALSLREMEYLDAAECLGFSRRRRLFAHLIPNVAPVTIAYAISDFVVVTLAIAGLSFLGAGIQPPTPEWGLMMSEGRLYLARAWWPVVFPGMLLALSAVAVAMIAEGFGSASPIPEGDGDR